MSDLISGRERPRTQAATSCNNPEIYSEHDDDDEQAPSRQIAAEDEEVAGDGEPEDAQAAEVLKDPAAGATSAVRSRGRSPGAFRRSPPGSPVESPFVG